MSNPATLRPTPKTSQALKMRLSELYIGWLTSAEAQDSIQTLVTEMLAAAEGMNHMQQAKQHLDPYTGNPVATEPPGSSTSPSPPPSPPLSRQRHPTRQAGKDDRASSPVHLSTRFLGVDEVDMSHRSTSPGGASPVSPNTAVHRAVVDPSIPLGAPAMQLKFGGDSTLPGSVASAAASGVGGLLGVPLETGASDRMSPVQSAGTSPHLPHTNSHGGSSFAMSLSSTPIQPASANDIPTLYRQGGVVDAPETESEELSALEGAFSFGAVRKVDVRKTFKRQQFAKITSEVFKLPEWLRDTLFRRIAASCGQNESGALTFDNIKQFYLNYSAKLSPNRRLFDLLRGDARRQYLTLDDFKAAVKQLVANHPGLSFLTQPEFQDFYCRTVAVRIVYSLERQQSRRVTWHDFDRSNLPETMRLLDRTGDINHVLLYFSYEHFYVLYCRFWEIDTDKDQLVGLVDLQNYGQGALTTAVLERVVAGAGRKLSSHVKGKLDFEDFIYFCLSEEDKNTPAAVRYWFQALDVDQDGVLSGFELQHFWIEQEARLREFSAEELKLEDMLCQMLDMVGANKIKAHPRGLTLGDLLSCQTPANFFNMIFNATKFLSFEHRDPFGEHQLKQMPEKTEWDRFARVEYDRMANEASQS